MKAENWLNKEAVKRKVAVERNVIAGNRFNVKIKVRARYNTEQAKNFIFVAVSQGEKEVLDFKTR